MAHDVFISYPAEAKATADAACAVLEGHGIRCWIAPRDVLPGSDWSESIVTAIQQSRLMVLIFDQNANESPHIKREVERAVDANIPIIPMRIQAVEPNKGLSYFISSPHWLDALNPPLEQHLQRLVHTARQLLGTGDEGSAIASVEYAKPAGDSRRWVPGVILGAILACVLIGGVTGVVLMRRQAAKPPAAPGTVAVTPTVSQPGPNRTGLRHHLERFVTEVERLDQKSALLLGQGAEVQLHDRTVRVLGASQIDLDSAEQLALQIAEVPLYSSVGSGLHGDRDEVFMQFGATAEHIAGFREMVPEMQAAAARAADAVREVATIRELDRCRAAYAPSLPPLADAYGDMLLAVHSREYLLTAALAHLAAARVIGDLTTHAESQWPKLASLATLPAIDLKHYSESGIEDTAARVRGMLDETRRQAQALADEKRRFTEQAVALWCRDIDPASRPMPSEPMERAIEKARSLRAAGKIDQADAALLALALIFQGADTVALPYVQTALSFHRSGLSTTGGLYIASADQRTDDWTAGLQTGAVLISYNGRPVTTLGDLSEAIRSAPPEQAVRFELACRDYAGDWRKQTGSRRRGGAMEATFLPL